MIEIELIIVMKRREKAIKLNTDAHHPLTDAQPISEQESVAPGQLPQFIC